MRWLIALLSLHGALTAATYQEFLSTLDIDKPASLCVATERFYKEFGGPNNPAQPAAMFALWDFHDRAVHAVNFGEGLGIFEGVPEADWERVTGILREYCGRSPKPKLVAVAPAAWRNIEPWVRCGFSIVPEWDDTIILDPDPRFLLKPPELLRPDLRAYLELYVNESPKWLDHDGALAIPWDRLRSRIRRWEHFRSEHASSPELNKHIRGVIHFMMELYLTGMDNSPVFQGRGPIQEYFRESYEQFLRINKDSQEYGLMRNAVDILKRNGWRLTPELLTLYREHGFSTEQLEREQ